VSDALDVAVDAARQAGVLLLRYFGALDPADVEEKSKNDLVSRADRESEDLVRRVLLGAFPNDRFLGEESGASSGGDPDAPTWIVDPLDGTANFVRGFPHWAVSIARTAKGPLGDLTIGVIWDPVKNDLFAGARGAGAFRNGKRLALHPKPGMDGCAIATGFPFRQQAKIDLYLSIFRQVFLSCRSLRRAGSAALDLAYTAAGVFDGFFEFGLSSWDTAAGAVLVREAGGLVSDFDGGERWRERGNVIAGTPGVHEGLLSIVRGVGVGEASL
jgi:myo-inositol-1(or 4)-monophosphatase